MKIEIESLNTNNLGTLLRIRLSEESLEYLISLFKFKKHHWKTVSRYQRLSESFIEKYKDFLDWYYISRYQKLSPMFIIEHLGRLDLRELASNRYRPLKKFNTIQRLRILQAVDEVDRKLLNRYFEEHREETNE